MSAKIPARGHTRKHTGTRKHHATGKHHPVHHRKTAAAHHGHHVHVAAKGAKPAKPRGFAVGDLLPVCSLEAVAMSLRLAGQPVGDDEVAWLWELAGAREVSIAEALEAAVRFGLAGCKGGEVRRVPISRPVLDGACNGPYGGLNPDCSALGLSWLPRALILGVDLPGPHAVLATPDGWWSWGELHAPWPCRVEEAWAVSWA